MAADFARDLYRHRQKDPDQTKKKSVCDNRLLLKLHIIKNRSF